MFLQQQNLTKSPSKLLGGFNIQLNPRREKA